MKRVHLSDVNAAVSSPIAPGTLFRFIVGGAVTLWPRPEHSVKDWSRGDLTFAFEKDSCLVLASRPHKDMFGSYNILVLTARGMLGWTTQSIHSVKVGS